MLVTFEMYSMYTFMKCVVCSFEMYSMYSFHECIHTIHFKRMRQFYIIFLEQSP